MTQMTADGVRGDEQPFGRVAIGETLGDQSGDGELGLGERRPARVWPSRRDQTPAHSEIPQTTAQSGGVASGTRSRIVLQGFAESLDPELSCSATDSRYTEIL